MRGPRKDEDCDFLHEHQWNFKRTDKRGLTLSVMEKRPYLDTK